MLQDSRFNKEVDKKTGYRTQSLLCMPILNYEGDLIGVAQIMNKTDGCPEFSEQDEDVSLLWFIFQNWSSIREIAGFRMSASMLSLSKITYIFIYSFIYMFSI